MDGALLRKGTSYQRILPATSDCHGIPDDCEEEPALVFQGLELGKF